MHAGASLHYLDQGHALCCQAGASCEVSGLIMVGRPSASRMHAFVSTVCSRLCRKVPLARSSVAEADQQE